MTYCSANEVRVKTYAFTPQPHQLWGGKLSRQQSTNGFTISTPHNNNKVFYHAAMLCVRWGERDRHSFSIYCKEADQRTFCRMSDKTWNLTSHLIQQAITGATLTRHRHVDTLYVDTNLKA